jgi:hypothetical protein
VNGMHLICRRSLCKSALVLSTYSHRCSGQLLEWATAQVMSTSTHVAMTMWMTLWMTLDDFLHDFVDDFG